MRRKCCFWPVNGRWTKVLITYSMTAGANAVITTRGSDGCFLAVGDKRIALPSFKVKSKDTTGAGDSFNAGVVLGRLVGLGWESAAALGNALGGLVTTQQGAGAASLNRNAVSRLVEKNLFQEEWTPSRMALEELTAWFEGLL